MNSLTATPAAIDIAAQIAKIRIETSVREETLGGYKIINCLVAK